MGLNIVVVMVAITIIRVNVVNFVVHINTNVVKNSGVVGVKLLGGGGSPINGAPRQSYFFVSWSGTRVMS